MATQSLIDITSLSPKFQDLYAKAKDFVEVILKHHSVKLHYIKPLSQIE